MFGFAQRMKYVAVNDEELDETVDFEPMKRKFCTPLCLWTSVFTGALIGCYYIPSIGLTFYQKWLYKTIRFPLLTVLVHMTVKYLMASLIRVLLASKFKPKIEVSWNDYLRSVAPTGVFSGIDIGFSNWGLEMISMSLYTMTKSTTIIFILFFSIIFKLEKKSWTLTAIVTMITIGLILFTYKSTYFNWLGFTLLLIASLASGIRWTCVQLLLQRSKMGMDNPIDMIYYMQPFMFLSVLPFAIWIEGGQLLHNYQNYKHDSNLPLIVMLVLLGAFIAFFMELSEVILVKYTSSLTLSIAGFIKEVFILVLAVEWNGDVVSMVNCIGLFIFLCGIASHVVHKITMSPTRVPRAYSVDLDRHELGESLIEKDVDYFSNESDGEKSDTQVLFDILNKHDK